MSEPITLTINLHPIQIKIIDLCRGGEDISIYTLRGLCSKLEIKSEPQRIKHHLEQLVKIGFIDKISGEYKYAKDRDEIMKYKEGLHWCSGSDDFALDGKARKGWDSIVIPLL